MDQEQKTTEVRTSNVQDGATNVQRETVSTASATDGRVVAQRVIWYIAGFIITLLAIRFVLFMLGANRDSGFVDFIYSVSGVFAAPFQNIFPAPVYGQFFFDTASLVAMAVYALVAWGIAKLFTLNSARTDV
ncbi:YggT family protein [Microbacteriaceae bacterium]|nr:YggT family protein [Candidatus Saccharibacteria bacterium]